MNTKPDPDHLDLDGRLLRLLVAVLDAGSVTAAAARLGVTQSAVSHQLDRLRAITGDPLFVKSGRRIVATARAHALAGRARHLLEGLREFATAERFDPARVEARLTVAANDLQRDLLLPALLQALRTQAPRVRLRVIASGIPEAAMLRDERCHLVITPRPPEGSDIVQKRLFSDDYRVFYDPAQWRAPPTRADYLAAEHVTVLYEPARPLDVDAALAARGVQRDFVVQVPGFGGIAPFVRGTRRLATVPGRLRTNLLRGLADAPVPLPCPRMPMYMVWHLRDTRAPLHRWLRAQLEAIVRPAVEQAGA